MTSIQAGKALSILDQRAVRHINLNLNVPPDLPEVAMQWQEQRI